MFKGDGNEIVKGEIFVDIDNRIFLIIIIYSNLSIGWIILFLFSFFLIYLNFITYIF